MPPSRRPPFLQVTIEYRVLGELDGLTPAPNVSLDPDSPDFVPQDERGIRVVNVEGNLGLIDPDLNGGGTQGSRCIPWVYLDTNGVVGAMDSQFGVVDVVPEPGIMVPSGQISPRFATGGLPDFFSRKPTIVPQGSALGIFGYPAGGAEKIVRLNIVAPDDPLEWADIQHACCCADFPCPEPPPTVSTISINQYEVGQTVEFDITGTALGVGTPESFVPLNYAFVDADTGGMIPAELVAQTTLTEARLRISSQNAPAGTYTLLARDPFEPDCSNVGQETPVSIQVTEAPMTCPTAASVAGDTQVVSASQNNVVVITGTNFGTGNNPNVDAVTISNGGGMLTVNSFTVVNDTELSVNFDADNTPGLYNIDIVPVNAQCPDVQLANAIEVT